MPHPRIALVFLAWVVSSAAFAAEGGRTRMSLVGVGVLSGVSSSGSPSAAATVSFDSRWGLGGGILAETLLAQGFGIEAGALYLKRPLRQTLTIPSLSIVSVTELSPVGVELPVLLRFHPSRVFSFGLGGYFVFATTGKIPKRTETTFGGSTTVSESESTFGNENHRRNDYGLVGSFAMTVPLGRLSLLLDARYLHGIPNLYTAAGSSYEVKSRVAEALLGVQLAL
jgi:hypothetical protein